MADIIDSILLRVLVDTNLSAKGSALTWVEEDTNFKIIRDRLALLSTATTNGFEAYNNGTVYSSVNPDYVVYNGNIYEFINVTPTAGQAPDVSPLYWTLVSTGAFTHQKDRDLYLAFGTSDEVSAEDIRNLLDSYPTDISDIYAAIDAIDLSPLWSITGNALTSRGSFGSISSPSSIYGFDFIKNGIVMGGLENDGSWFFGTTAKFTDTSFSFKSLGNDNTTVGEWLKNSSDTTLYKVLNGGEFLIGRSDLVGGTQFNIKALGSSSSFYPIYVVNSSNVELFQLLGNGKTIFGPTGGTTEFMNIGASAANTYIRINADTGYDTGFRLYENNVFKGGFLRDSVASTTSYYGASAVATLNIDDNNNLGYRTTSFGSGEGVFGVKDATTDASANPTAGFVLQSKSGRAKVYETDGSLSFLVKAVASTKTIGGAPYTNDGYVEIVIDGVTLKVMTTA